MDVNREAYLFLILRQHRENSYWYRGTADAMAQNLSFLKNSHEPYVVIASVMALYKMDYNKVLEYHIAKKADFTVVTANVEEKDDPSRFGVVSTDAITEL